MLLTLFIDGFDSISTTLISLLRLCNYLFPFHFSLSHTKSLTIIFTVAYTWIYSCKHFGTSLSLYHISRTKERSSQEKALFQLFSQQDRRLAARAASAVTHTALNSCCKSLDKVVSLGKLSSCSIHLYELVSLKNTKIPETAYYTRQ